jgi:hypothetical protein
MYRLLVLLLLIGCSDSVIEPEAELPDLSGRWVGEFLAKTSEPPDSIKVTLRQNLNGDLSGLGSYTIIFMGGIEEGQFVVYPGRFWGVIVPPNIVTLFISTPFINGYDYQADGIVSGDTLHLVTWLGRRRVPFQLVRCSNCYF